MPPPSVSGSAPRNTNPLSMRREEEAPAGPAPQAHPPKDADTFEAKPSMPGATVKGSPGVQHTDGRLSANAQHSQLPSDLKSKIDKKVWDKLPPGQRSTLIASYQSFKRAGVWDEVRTVTGEKEKREAPVGCCGGQTHVHGNSGGIQYELKNRKVFTEKLMVDNPQFGLDGGFMGAMHPGQASIREAGPPTSLHVSIGPGDKMDAHIDQVNPVDMPKDHQTQMNVLRGIEHWSKEVLPEMIRKTTGIPGLVIAPELIHGNRENGGAEGKITANLVFNGWEKVKPRVEKEPMEGSENVPPKVLENLAKNPAITGMQFPRPKGVTKDEAPDPKALAAAIAAKVQAAVENGDSRITIDIPSYAGQKGYQTAASADVGRIARHVLAELKAQGVDVSGISAVTVTYGKRNAKDKLATEGETIALR